MNTTPTLRKVVRGVFAAAASLALCAGLAACGSGSSSDPMLDTSDTSGGVAATVNGVEIGENAITAYIQNFRTSQEMDDDAAWGEWLAGSGMDAATIRSSVIDYYVENELTRQLAKELGVDDVSADVDAELEEQKAYFESDEAYQEALAESGMSEEMLRYQIETSKLQEAIAATDDTPIADDELLPYVQSYATVYNGAKESSHILFAADDEATAQQVLDQINSGELSFEDAVAQYSTDEGSKANGGSVGWDKTTSFVTEYQTALDGLEEGQVSGLVTSEFGIHIIKCTGVLNADSPISSLDQVPESFVEYVRTSMGATLTQSRFYNMLEEFRSTSTIEVTDMPEGLPYAVAVPVAVSSDDAEQAPEDAAAEGDVEGVVEDVEAPTE